MTPLGRAVAVGATLAVVFVAVAVGAVVLGFVEIPSAGTEPGSVLLIGLGQDSSGSQVADVAIYVEQDRVRVLDTRKAAIVPGTTATSAREAYAFGGGEAVRSALSEQGVSPQSAWMVMSSAVFAELIDDAGGLPVSIPQDTSVYGNGLVVFSAGDTVLDGSEALAYARAIGSFDATAQGQAAQDFDTAVAGLVERSRPTLARLAQDPRVEVSADRAAVAAYLAK